MDPPKVAREQFVGANDEFQFPPLPPLVGKGSSENNTGVHGRRNLGLVRALILTPTGNLQTSRTLSVLLCKRGHPNCADYEHALRVVSTRPFQGAMVSIQRVPLPSSIQVHGIVAGISQDQLCVYFESSAHSGGGEVDGVRMFEDQEFAIVKFKESKREFPPGLPFFCVWKRTLCSYEIHSGDYIEFLGSVAFCK